LHLGHVCYRRRSHRKAPALGTSQDRHTSSPPSPNAGTATPFGIQAADDGVPCGEARYVGEEAYDGLEFHYYFCDVGDAPVFRGWISDSE
jgi:hypothetical protein